MRVVKAEQQIGERGLAGTAGADEGDHLPGFDREVDPAQYKFVAVGKMNVVELNRRVRRAQENGLRGLANGVPGFQQFKNPLAGGAGLGQLVVETAERFQRLIHQENAADELEKIARRRARVAQEYDVKKHQRYAQRGEEFNQGARQLLGADDPHHLAEETPGRFPELREDRGFQVVSFDDAVGGERFVHEVGQLGRVRLHGFG